MHESAGVPVVRGLLVARRSRRNCSFIVGLALTGAYYGLNNVGRLDPYSLLEGGKSLKVTIGYLGTLEMSRELFTLSNFPHFTEVLTSLTSVIL